MKPRKPLKRRTPMPRGTTPLKRTGFKPKPQDLNGTPRGSGLARSRGFVGAGVTDGPTTTPRGPVKQRLESSTIPPAIREAVLERDGYSCQRCGRYLVDTIRYGLQHRRPRGAGGSRLLHTMANLVTLCGWVGDAGTCTDHVEEQDRAGARRDGWLAPHGVTPEEWPVLRWTAAGHEWQQPGEQWAPATPHPRQLELGGCCMSQQDMDQLRGELRQQIAGRLGWTPNEEKAAAWHEAVEAALDVAVPIEASRRDWAAIAMLHDMFFEHWERGTLDDPEPLEPGAGAPCSCLTPEGAAFVAAQPKWSLPLCAVHPEADR